MTHSLRHHQSLEEQVVELARKKRKKLATVESCTGGLIAHRMTNVPGASDIFLSGWVTYSNDAKIRQAGVLAKTLDQYGAVSKETAVEMALGGLKASGADMSVAVTGIAGPGGGTPQKPVGLVYFGLAWKEEEGSVRTQYVERQFKGSREEFKQQTSEEALKLFYDCLQSYSSS